MNNVFKDLAYSARSASQKLDIYLPSRVPRPYPVIVWLHPGGYTQGDKNMVGSVLGFMLDRGYAVAGVNYRLADESPFPAQLLDVKAAVRWLKANAANYNLDRENVSAWGVSAGSTFAALLGTTAGVKELEDLSMGSPGESCRVSAVVDIIGPVDLFNLDSQLVRLGHEPMHDDPGSGICRLVGGRLAKSPDKCRAVNPVTYLAADCPPFYLQHGTADHVVPYLQSVNFARALADAVGREKVELNLLENVDHFDAAHNSPENVGKALDFLDKFLKPV
jgi:acetyl esterase/lipase